METQRPRNHAFSEAGSRPRCSEQASVSSGVGEGPGPPKRLWFPPETLHACLPGLSAPGKNSPAQLLRVKCLLVSRVLETQGHMALWPPTA